MNFGYAFNLSLQTLSTIGYGHLTPDTLFGNWVIVVESFVSLLVLAMITGIAFAKFAKPKASVVFSKVMTVNTLGKYPAMHFRVLNATPSKVITKNEIFDVWFRATLLRIQNTKDGKRVLCTYRVKLKQKRFISMRYCICEWKKDHLWSRLTADLVHVMDERSPFYKMEKQDMENSDYEIRFVMSGVESTLNDTIHEQYVYDSSMVRNGNHL